MASFTTSDDDINQSSTLQKQRKLQRPNRMMPDPNSYTKLSRNNCQGERVGQSGSSGDDDALIARQLSSGSRKRGFHDLGDHKPHLSEYDETVDHDGKSLEPSLKKRRPSSVHAESSLNASMESPKTRAATLRGGQLTTPTSIFRSRQLGDGNGNGRPSRFVEGSMNDRVSARPPSSYLKKDNEHMEDYIGQCSGISPIETIPAFNDKDASTSSSRPQSGIFRFGRTLVSAFNPMKWTHNSKRTSVTPIIVDDRKLKAERAHSELKASGTLTSSLFGGQASARRSKEMNSDSIAPRSPVDGQASGLPRDSGIDLDFDENERDVQVFASSESLILAGATHDRIRAKSPATTETIGSLELGFKSTSSVEQILGEKYASTGYLPSTIKSDHQASQKVVKKQPSRKDLQKALKLKEKVSEMESRLEKAKRELEELGVEMETESPLGSSSVEEMIIPEQEDEQQEARSTPMASERVRRERFIPGRLPTVFSEGVLLSPMELGENDESYAGVSEGGDHGRTNTHSYHTEMDTLRAKMNLKKGGGLDREKSASIEVIEPDAFERKYAMKHQTTSDQTTLPPPKRKAPIVAVDALAPDAKKGKVNAVGKPCKPSSLRYKSNYIDLSSGAEDEVGTKPEVAAPIHENAPVTKIEHQNHRSLRIKPSTSCLVSKPSTIANAHASPQHSSGSTTPRISHRRPVLHATAISPPPARHHIDQAGNSSLTSGQTSVQSPSITPFGSSTFSTGSSESAVAPSTIPPVPKIPRGMEKIVKLAGMETRPKMSNAIQRNETSVDNIAGAEFQWPEDVF